jgi:hypothetical protein
MVDISRLAGVKIGHDTRDLPVRRALKGPEKAINREDVKVAKGWESRQDDRISGIKT